MEVVTSPHRHLHPIMEENLNSSGELLSEEDEIGSQFSEYEENLFLSEDSLDFSDNEIVTSRKDGSLTLTDYYISSLTGGLKINDDSCGHCPKSDWSSASNRIVSADFDDASGSDSGDFSSDSLNNYSKPIFLNRNVTLDDGDFVCDESSKFFSCDQKSVRVVKNDLTESSVFTANDRNYDTIIDDEIKILKPPRTLPTLADRASVTEPFEMQAKNSDLAKSAVFAVNDRSFDPTIGDQIKIVKPPTLSALIERPLMTEPFGMQTKNNEFAKSEVFTASDRSVNPKINNQITIEKPPRKSLQPMKKLSVTEPFKFKTDNRDFAKSSVFTVKSCFDPIIDEPTKMVTTDHLLNNETEFNRSPANISVNSYKYSPNFNCDKCTYNLDRVVSECKISDLGQDSKFSNSDVSLKSDFTKCYRIGGVNPSFVSPKIPDFGRDSKFSNSDESLKSDFTKCDRISGVNPSFISPACRKHLFESRHLSRSDSSLISIDSLDDSFCRSTEQESKNNARNLSCDSAFCSFSSSQQNRLDSADTSRTSSDNSFLETLNRSFSDINENLQSIKQLSSKKFEGTLQLREYLENCESFNALLEKYVSLKNRAEGIQTEAKLKAELSQLKDDIVTLADHSVTAGGEKIDHCELETCISQTKRGLESLKERKLKLTLVNMKVHQFKTESGISVDDLKAEVAKLYQIWDHNFNRVSTQLESLQRASNIWKQFQAHRNEFLSALVDDEKTIQILDSALQDGDISPDIATSVRIVAKVLSEKRDDNSPPESLTETLSGATSLLDPCSGEGSFSDSGISDSGSEQDICEREKRLGEIKKLAKEMDSLSPGSLFAIDVNKRVQEMESKLRELQRNCRNLIVKTALCAETSCPVIPVKQILITPKRSKSPVLMNESNPVATDGGGDDDKPSQFWRILKCSMPFHLAVMLVVCVACLLEPHCCDSLNNFQRSIAPQMRYLYGPPPI